MNYGRAVRRARARGRGRGRAGGRERAGFRRSAFSAMELPSCAPHLRGMRPEHMRMQLAAEELGDEVAKLLPIIARRNRNAADHLQRSVESVLNNMAEGIAAWRSKVKIDRYEISRREANEARAILRRLVRQGILTEDQARRAYNLAGAVIGMLTNATKAIENR